MYNLNAKTQRRKVYLSISYIAAQAEFMKYFERPLKREDAKALNVKHFNFKLHMRILFINKAHPVLQDLLTEAGHECVEAYKESKEEIESGLSAYDGVVLRSRINVDRQFIDAGTQLRFIAREGIGLEHIDTAYAEAKGIKVFNAPEGSRDAVGENAIGMLLNLMNNISRADRQVRAGIWSREENRAVELKGKTIGIIGYGNTGSAFAQKISGFEVKCLAYDKYKTKYGDAYAEEASLDRIYAEADVVTVHIPYENDNHYFVNTEFLASFRKNIFLLNTARGLVLKTAALTAALKSGKVRGAGLDVLEYEESSFAEVDFTNLPEPFQYLCKADNVVLAPHIAGWSFESKRKHGEVLAAKILKAFS